MNSINVNNVALNIKIAFDHPWLLLLIIPAAAILLLPFLLLPKERRKNIKKVLPLILHITAAVVLILILSGIQIINVSNETAVVLLVDTSYSTVGVKAEIEKNAEELFKIIDASSPCGVVAFGQGQVYSVDMESDEGGFILNPADDTVTDIEAALEYAASICPQDKGLRIILLTDGKQTQGDGDSKAYYLATKGVRIDAMYYDTTNQSFPEIQIGGVSCPEGAYKNAETVITAEIKSNVEESVFVKLLDNGIETEKREILLAEGSNVLDFKVIPQSTGVHNYTLLLEGENDTVLKNNEASCMLRVDGKSSILIITEDLASVERLSELISPDSEVDVVRAYNAPTSLVELCKYDQIIISNVNYHSFTSKFFRSVDSYVSSYGRTLLAVGGRDTFMFGGMEGTELEDMLPVSFNFDEKDFEDSIAIMLVLDCSSSMGGKNDYISIAKQGAIKCLESLNENDYAGVISFSTNAKLESSLISASQTNKDSLTRVISGLTIASGTYYTEAVEMACDELRKSDADIKHIIFLSDGQPVDKGYDNVIIDASAEGITVSTIGLAYSSNILEYMAMYGKGRYYYVASADELPDVMLSEAEQARVDPMIDGDFVPVVRDANEFTELLDLKSLPPLGGYLGTTLKENASAHLISENGHPVYASWQYGKGTVACFTSDLNGKWSSSWFGDDGGKKAILSMVKSTLGEVHHNSSIVLNTELDGNFAKISVNTAGDDNRNKVNITLSWTGGEESFEIPYVYDGFYQTTVPINGEGLYEIKVTEKDVIDRQVDSLDAFMVVPYSLEYDMFIEGGKEFLSGLCSYSEGAIYTDINQLAAVKTPGIELVYHPVVPLAIIAAIMMLVDIAVRKLRWKDIRQYFVKGGKG